MWEKHMPDPKNNGKVKRKKVNKNASLTCGREGKGTILSNWLNHLITDNSTEPFWGKNTKRKQNPRSTSQTSEQKIQRDDMALKAWNIPQLWKDSICKSMKQELEQWVDLQTFNIASAQRPAKTDTPAESRVEWGTSFLREQDSQV